MAWKTIRNKGACIHDEYTAAEASLAPGMLVTLNTSGNLKKHDASGHRTAVMLVEENALYGRDVTTAYSNADRVGVLLPPKGATVNVLVASGENIAIGDELVSNGSGLFVEGTAPSTGAQDTGVLVQAVETAGVLAANTLVACRVL